MRIISKYRDFYDGLQDHSKDHINKVWVREHKKIKDVIPFTENEMEKLQPEWNLRMSNYWLYYLSLAGKIYPYIVINSTEGPIYLWSYEEANEYFKFDENKKAKFFDKRDSIKKFFESEYPDTINIHIKYNTPSIVFNSRQIGIDPTYIHYGTYQVVVELNPPLKDIGFSRRLDSYQTYQELDYFVSNVLTKEEEMPEFDNKIKLESKGFDNITSFRKGKKSEEI